MPQVLALQRMKDAGGEIVKRLVPQKAEEVGRTWFTADNKECYFLILQTPASRRNARVQFFAKDGTLLFEPQVRYASPSAAQRSAERRVKRFKDTGSWFMDKAKQEESGFQDQEELYSSFLPVQNGDTPLVESE